MENCVTFDFQVSGSAYQLIPKTTIGSRAGSLPRSGSLLRIQFEEGQVGYADCFPWPELGDEPLVKQLEKLKNRRLTPLTRRSIELARVDARGRVEKQNLGYLFPSPASHALIVDLQNLSSTQLVSCAAQGFSHIKIKLGLRWIHEVKILLEFSDLFKLMNLKIRLDLNASLLPNEVHTFLTMLKPILTLIDFIEDPCPYDAAIWAFLQSRWNVRLAMDRLPMDCKLDETLKRDSFSVLIHKPAIQDPDLLMELADRLGTRVVVTSYLDHPLGQLGAAWTAASLAWRYPERIETCGLLSHFAYEENTFSNYLKSKGPCLVPPSEGFGFGLDEALTGQLWRPL